MTRGDIIEILEWHPSHVEHGASGLLSRIERVVAVAIAAEREALERCKQVCAATAEEWRTDAKEWKAQRDALLEALKMIDKEFKKHGRQHWSEAVKARAAIAKAEENICTSNVGNVVRPGVLEPHQLVNARRKKT